MHHSFQKDDTAVQELPGLEVDRPVVDTLVREGRQLRGSVRAHSLGGGSLGGSILGLRAQHAHNSPFSGFLHATALPSVQGSLPPVHSPVLVTPEQRDRLAGMLELLEHIREQKAGEEGELPLGLGPEVGGVSLQEQEDEELRAVVQRAMKQVKRMSGMLSTVWLLGSAVRSGAGQRFQLQSDAV